MAASRFPQRQVFVWELCSSRGRAVVTRIPHRQVPVWELSFFFPKAKGGRDAMARRGSKQCQDARVLWKYVPTTAARSADFQGSTACSEYFRIAPDGSNRCQGVGTNKIKARAGRINFVVTVFGKSDKPQCTHGNSLHPRV